ncbi:sce7726 family protein [Erythrobacteraceae bacterium WH01K]|nr:sce7726 family protein [Erythrobacteraceae bacterium WH01K]
MLEKKKQAKNTRYVAASRLFSTGVLRNIAKKGDFSEFRSLCVDAGIDLAASEEKTAAHAFESAFELLRTSGLRSEYVYKAALTHNVLLGTHSLATASMVNEFRAGRSKADVVIFNGTSTAYEIKSDRDNLGRLAGQIADYRRVFARNFVICSASHLNEVQSVLPDDVGILLLTRWNRISTFRTATPDISSLCLNTIFSSLTNLEIKNIIAKCGERVPDVPNTRLRRTMSKTFEHLNPANAHNAMVATLRKTRSKESLREALQNFPKSVMPAVMNLRLTMPERENLSNAMKVKLASL